MNRGFVRIVLGFSLFLTGPVFAQASEASPPSPPADASLNSSALDFSFYRLGKEISRMAQTFTKIDESQRKALRGFGRYVIATAQLALKKTCGGVLQEKQKTGGSIDDDLKGMTVQGLGVTFDTTMFQLTAQEVAHYLRESIVFPLLFGDSLELRKFADGLHAATVRGKKLFGIKTCWDEKGVVVWIGLSLPGLVSKNTGCEEDREQVIPIASVSRNEVPDALLPAVKFHFSDDLLKAFRRKRDIRQKMLRGQATLTERRDNEAVIARLEKSLEWADSAKGSDLANVQLRTVEPDFEFEDFLPSITSEDLKDIGTQIQEAKEKLLWTRLANLEIVTGLLESIELYLQQEGAEALATAMLRIQAVERRLRVEENDVLADRATGLLHKVLAAMRAQKISSSEFNKAYDILKAQNEDLFAAEEEHKVRVRPEELEGLLEWIATQFDKFERL